MDDGVNSYIAKRMIELLNKSLVLTDNREAVREGWLGELLIKLRLRRRKYTLKMEMPSNKVLRVVRCARLKLPKE